MAKIPASKVLVRRRYIVDCDVCDEAVEPESGGFESRREAERAKQRHLDNHAEETPASAADVEGLNDPFRRRY